MTPHNRQGFQKIVRPLGNTVHTNAGRLFPSLKTAVVRQLNRHVRLSNVLRSTIGKPAISAPLIEENHGFLAAGRQDISRAVSMLVIKSARQAVNTPELRIRILPLLEPFPRFRRWLKYAVYAPPTETNFQDSDDLKTLTPRGLMIYGLLSSLEQRKK